MADINLIDVPFLDWPLSVLSSTNTPPGSPTLGDAYIVGSAPTGAWVGHANAIARWNDASAWEYQTPAAGRTVWNVATSAFNRWTGSAWSVLNDLPSGGTIGQVLAKTSGTDYAVAWSAPASGTITEVIAGTALTGGGSSGPVTLNVALGTTGSTAAAGNDSRLSDDRTASGVRTATGIVSVSAASAPTSGQVLTATSGTAATWQTPSGGSGGPTTIYYFANPESISNAVGVVGDIAYAAGGGAGSNTFYFKDAANAWQVGATLGASTAPVTSVFGRLGAVTAQTGDYTPTQVGLGNVTNDSQLKRSANDFSTFASKVANGNERIVIEDIDASGVKKYTTSASIAALATPSGAAGGDLGGTYPNPTVTQARGLKSATTTVDVSSATAPASGQVLTATSGSAATWQSPAGGTPSGAAGGDLGGAYPNPTVTQARGLVTATGTVAVSAATAPTTGQVLTATSATTADWQAPAGGPATALATTGAAVNVNAAAPPSSGQALIATDATHATWQNLSGGGTITAVNPGTGLTGGGSSGSVSLAVSYGTTAGTAAEGNDARLSDDRTASGIRTATGIVAVSTAAAPSAGQTLVATGPTAATWQTISGGSGSGYSNVYLAAPTSPGSLDDEFTSGSSDLATRGWTVTNDSGTTMTRVGDVTLTYPNTLTSTQYRSTLTGSGMLIQSVSKMNVSKAVAGSWAFSCDMRANHQSTDGVYFYEAPMIWDVFPPKLDNTMRRVYVGNFTANRFGSQMNTPQAYTTVIANISSVYPANPWYAWLDWESAGKNWRGLFGDPLTERIISPTMTTNNFSTFTLAAAGFGLQTARSSSNSWVCVRHFRQMAQGTFPGVP